MGSVPLRTLGLRWALGLDLGGRRALGIRAVPLRTMGVGRRRMVLGAGSGCGASGVGAGSGGVCRRRPGLPLLGWRWRGMVPLGAGRSVRAWIPREPHIRE